MSLSLDGAWLAVGAPMDSKDNIDAVGATFVFRRDPSTASYIQQGSKYIGTPHLGSSQQGKGQKVLRGILSVSVAL